MFFANANVMELLPLGHNSSSSISVVLTSFWCNFVFADLNEDWKLQNCFADRA